MTEDERDRFLYELREEMRAGFARVDQRIEAAAAENRRHFGVIAESLQSKIELVIDGLNLVNEKVDRFRGEVQDEFHKVDRRLLHVSARLAQDN